MKARYLLVIGLLLAGWWLGRPQVLSPEAIVEHQPDPANGERMFLVGGCGNCHGRVENGKPNPAVLAGGMELHSPVGIFRAPNISSHAEQGIGNWSDVDFINAMKRGVDPDGRHLYPSFPYTSYARMSVTDLLDLKAFLDTMPVDEQTVEDHELSFPWNQRWLLGYWKRLYLDEQPVMAANGNSDAWLRGQYLVEGPGHCGECHTSRNAVWAMDASRWLSGAPSLEGEGRVPNLTPHSSGLEDWSASDISYYLESGVDPDYDIVGGSMVAVQENFARLPASDREAVAAYIKSLPPLARTP